MCHTCRSLPERWGGTDGGKTKVGKCCENPCKSENDLRNEAPCAGDLLLARKLGHRQLAEGVDQIEGLEHVRCAEKDGQQEGDADQHIDALLLLRGDIDRRKQQAAKGVHGEGRQSEIEVKRR